LVYKNKTEQDFYNYIGVCENDCDEIFFFLEKIIIKVKDKNSFKFEIWSVGSELFNEVAYFCPISSM
jgi:hypothetical protein